jgi:small ligand-binding sensory domain FIST
VTILPMRLGLEQTPDGPLISGWPDELPAAWPPGAALLLLGEPFSFPADALLARLNDDRPGVPVVGGMASGAWEPGQNRLLLGAREIDAGAVAALVHGPVRVGSVVSQGCRPVGRPYVVTKAQRNVILELSGRPPLAQLADLLDALSPRERDQLRHGLHVGCVVNEYQQRFARGDFLVRNVVGADPDSGAIAIGDWVRTGQTVQFHVRDEQSADEDLRALAEAAAAGRPAGAHLFTCNGRGTRMFSQPDHDARVVRDALGDIPLAGFFAQGEIGPVGGRNHLHGFTASLALFEPAAE